VHPVVRDSRRVATFLRVADHSALRVVRTTERTVTLSRLMLSRLMDRAQFRLRVLELRLDPEAKRWVSEARAAVTRGDIAAELKDQPPVELIIDQWHRSQPAT